MAVPIKPERVFSVPHEVPPEWLACRGQRVHWLKWIPVPADRRTPGVVDVWWRCTRCTSERYDQLDPVTLERVRSPRYWHPDGYLEVDSGSGVPAPVAWKIAYLNLLGALNKREAGKARRYHKELWQQQQETGT